jgi:hypothetical protein
MRNIFAPRLFRNLTIPERILHALVIFGLPLSIFDYVTGDLGADAWVLEIPLALFGGIVAAIVLALLEHVFFKVTKRAGSERAKKWVGLVAGAEATYFD